MTDEVFTTAHTSQDGALRKVVVHINVRRRSNIGYHTSKAIPSNIKHRVNERFVKMSENYETEQKTLEARVTELKAQIAAEKESRANIDGFLSIVKKYTDIQELTAEVIREFAVPTKEKTA